MGQLLSSMTIIQIFAYNYKNYRYKTKSDGGDEKSIRFLPNYFWLKITIILVRVLTNKYQN